MQQVTDQQRVKPWMGFVLFVILMAFFLTAGKAMQRNWGAPGLISCELAFLILAVVYALIFRIPLKEMFPVKKFTGREFAGSLLLTAGTGIFGLISITIVGIIYPASLKGSDVQSLDKYMNGGLGYFVVVFIMAVMPAVCEEAIHRGAILTNFRSVKKEWIVVLIMGLFFGINHWSVLRFINTMLMGCCLSYIVIKRNNILLASCMHFLNNFASVSYSYLSNLTAARGGGVKISGDDISTMMDSGILNSSLRSYLMIGVGAPFLIVAGLCLLSPETHKKIRFIFAGILAGIMLTSSFAIFIHEEITTVLKKTYSYTVVLEGSETKRERIEIIYDGTYDINCTLLNSDGNYDMKIEDLNEEIIWQDSIPTGNVRTYSGKAHLDSGYYYFRIVNKENSLNDQPVFSVQIKTAQVKTE